MNSQSSKDSSLTSQTRYRSDTHNKMDELSQQALEYAEHEFGIGHPVWQSIHDQVACFCKSADSCGQHKKDGSKPGKSTH
jgi:hypothetical protein